MAESSSARGGALRLTVLGLLTGPARGFFPLGPSPAVRASVALQRQLVEGYGRPLAEGARAEVDDLIEELRAARVRFDPRVLSDGLWYVAYMAGPQPRWKLGRTQLAGQRYQLREGRTTNYAEIVGSALCLVVEADLRALDGASSCPKDFELAVTSASVRFGTLGALTVPIRGRGRARLLFGDERLRIFLSPKESESGWEQDGLVVCQLPGLALFGEEWRQTAALDQ
ncbi:hypothetical protein T492DRAFT_926068 [Pavlovales sp. CCMP2436]|nr:hypothetical protein T492DRAFT_926068 [Pavlovales sp. CCMP2436]